MFALALYFLLVLCQFLRLFLKFVLLLGKTGDLAHTYFCQRVRKVTHIDPYCVILEFQLISLLLFGLLTHLSYNACENLAEAGTITLRLNLLQLFFPHQSHYIL